jgi:hypothetical protein
MNLIDVVGFEITLRGTIFVHGFREKWIKLYLLC